VLEFESFGCLKSLQFESFAALEIVSGIKDLQLQIYRKFWLFKKFTVGCQSVTVLALKCYSWRV
jgi:hypothetical protein